MDRLDLYKEMYKREIERRTELSNDLNIPIGLITVLVSAAVFFLTSYEFKNHNFLTIFFAIALLCGFYFLANSIRYLIFSYNIFTGHEGYKYTPFAEDLEIYYQNLLTYGVGVGKTPSQAATDADTDFENYIRENYKRNATDNTTINDNRSTSLFKCKDNMARSLICLLIAAVPFTINYFSKGEKIEKIQIVNKDSVLCK